MARRSNNIEVAIVGDADFRAARREASRAFDRIESDGRDAAQDIEQAFDRIDIDPDTEGFASRLTQAGEEGAAGIADALGGIDFNNIGGSALSSLTGALSAAGPWVAAAGAIAAVFGDELMQGFESAMGRRKNDVIRAITSGASEAELAVAGRAAGEAWSSGFGESTAELKANADELVRVLGDMVDEADFGPMLEQAQVLADLLGVDVTQAAELARRTVKQGLADDWQDAFDDMIGVTQEFGQTGVEALDILEEFGSNFARFEVDGGRAVQFVASSFRDGLIPTIDRAGEIFEEFTTRIVDADAQDAIEELGLGFREIQAAVAEGGPAAAAAMEDVVSALLETESAADRARLANVIFGQSFEQVNDEGELLSRLLTVLTDDTDAYAGAAEDAAGSLEETVTGFERLKRSVVDVGGIVGEFADSQLRDLYDGFDLIGDAAGWTADKLWVWGDSAEDVSDGSDEMAESIRFAAIEANIMGDEASYAAGEISDLRNEFEQLAGFGPDKTMRDLAAATDDVTDSLDVSNAAAVGFSGQIDITTDSGRRLQSRLERLSESLFDAKQKMDDGELSAYDYATAQARAEANVRQAGAAAGLSASQVQGLIDKYLNIIGLGDIRTRVTVDFDGSFAVNEMARFIRLRDNIRSVGSTSTRTTASVSRTTSSSRTTSGRIQRRAKGGPTTGLTLVGEEGPELADFGSRGGYVHNNRDTRRMISQAAGSFTGGRGAAPVVIRIESGGSRLDDVLVEMMRKAISNRGGGTVAVLG